MAFKRILNDLLMSLNPIEVSFAISNIVMKSTRTFVSFNRADISQSDTIFIYSKNKFYPESLQTVAQCITSKKQCWERPNTIKCMSPWDKTKQLTYLENAGIADSSWEEVWGFRNLLIVNERLFRNRERKLAAETLCIEAERAIAETIICLQNKKPPYAENYNKAERQVKWHSRW